MDVGDDLGLGEGKDVAVVEKILLVAGELFSTGIRFLQIVGPDGGAHGAIEDENAFSEGGGESVCEIGLHRLGVRIGPKSHFSRLHIVKSGYVDAFVR